MKKRYIIDLYERTYENLSEKERKAFDKIYQQFFYEENYKEEQVEKEYFSKMTDEELDYFSCTKKLFLIRGVLLGQFLSKTNIVLDSFEKL